MSRVPLFVAQALLIFVVEIRGDFLFFSFYPNDIYCRYALYWDFSWRSYEVTSFLTSCHLNKTKFFLLNETSLKFLAKNKHRQLEEIIARLNSPGHLERGMINNRHAPRRQEWREIIKGKVISRL